MHGRHLTLAERELLAIGLALGATQAEVAKELGCHPSTIRRELKRNQVEGTYLAAQAQVLADQRGRASKAPWKLERPELAAFVQEGLREYWSPEEIAGRVGIEQRPAIVDGRKRLGDWESDRVEGSGSTAGLASHVERKSRYTVLAQLADGKAATFNEGTIRAFERYGELPRRTITADNGKEFAAHAGLAAGLGLDVYFARPYRAWERGTNENTNGLVRQFFPKGLDLRQVTPRQVAHVERLLNNRPRKCLGYRTPLEVLRRL